MTSRVRIALLVALCVAQVGTAGWSIARYESTLASGALYRIPTAAIDPADAFRGRYVAVQPSISIPEPVDPGARRIVEDAVDGERPMYVQLAPDGDGLARVARIMDAPTDDGNYLQVDRVWPVWGDRQGGDRPRIQGYTLTFSFDRYYMNESLAPAAEQRYVEAARRQPAPRTWLTVKVKDGVGVIEGLFVDGVPIEDAVADPDAQPRRR
jgi:uncharacterized membrane-anchored protein